MRHDALVLQLIELGLMTALEEQTGRPLAAPKPLKRVPAASMVPSLLAAGGPASRRSSRPRSLALGDLVRARNVTPAGHTRLPRYARGKEGEIVAVHGTHVFPDSNAHGLGEDPHWLYTVRFTSQALWGLAGRDSVCIDLWEPYLEKVA
jgi:nitrile hydratase